MQSKAIPEKEMKIDMPDKHVADFGSRQIDMSSKLIH
jgi:hypothetical protein